VIYDELTWKVKTLNDTIWERRFVWPDIQAWLDNFADDVEGAPSERLHALFLLSNFTYFNPLLMRTLLRSLYRDFVQQPALIRLRRRRKGTLDIASLEAAYKRVQRTMRFVGMGNPAESGTHLLYYFRQENDLPTKLFVHLHELYEGTARSPKIAQGVRYVIFIDDFCGSGTQAVRYSKAHVARIKEIAPNTKLYYYCLFATSAGLKKVREKAKFDHAEAVCELDSSFTSLEENSRYFRHAAGADIDRTFCREMCHRYGKSLIHNDPLGFGGCQLLFGFAHNIPNNTLPIFWSDGGIARQWAPLFRRYTKVFKW